MPSPYADHAHVSASSIQGECRDRLLADCHDWAEEADAKRQSTKWSKSLEAGMTYLIDWEILVFYVQTFSNADFFFAE